MSPKPCGSGMRRFTLPELSGMELYEVVHVRRCFAGELIQCVRHTVVTSLPGQLRHGREMADEVFRKPRLPKAFAPRREWDVAISDGPAKRLGEDARIVVQIGRFRPRQIVDHLKIPMLPLVSLMRSRNGALGSLWVMDDVQDHTHTLPQHLSKRTLRRCNAVAPSCRYCCKSPKLPGPNFPAV